jgi:preprotein translocase subunit SecY
VSQPLEAFKNSFKIPELKQRIIFTLGMLAIYRLGTFIPTPGVDGQALSAVVSDSGGLLGFYNMFTGGAFEQASVFALGIMPYISASIIMQLLVAVIPFLEKLHKEGAEGQKKITEYTRYGTIGLGIVQSVGMAFLIQNMSQSASQPFVANPGMGFFLMCVLSFTTGCAFIMWLGEQISEHGVGNGISLIIFISIVSGLPKALARIFQMYETGSLDIIRIMLLIASMVAVVAGAIYVTTANRRVPVQYPRQVKGKKVFQGARNYLPLKVNQAGVIPIIFASSVLMLPTMLVGAVGIAGLSEFFQVYFTMGSPLYNATYALLIIFFSFFYTAITFNPVEMADNLKKYGGVIMGVRPGKQTAEHLKNIMTRVTFVGSIFLAGVALVPQFIYSQVGVNDMTVTSFFGGTSLLILVGVGLDTVRQIETHLVMRNYEGFMKGRRVRGRRT